MKFKAFSRLAALLICLSSSLAHAFDIRPMDGLWGIVDEQQLAVGRALNLELGGTVLVLTMYAYNRQGAPTFYVGAGSLTTTNTASIPLSEPQGGTCFGCPVTSGRLLSSPGNVTFEFTSSTTGFVTLPGESRKAIAKGLVTRSPAPEGLKGAWVFTYIAGTTVFVSDVVSLTSTNAPTTRGNGLVTDNTGRYGCEQQITGTYAGYILCLKLTASGATDRFAIAKLWGNDLDGVWYYTVGGTAYLFTGKRLLDGASNQMTVKRSETQDPIMRAALESLGKELSGVQNATD